MKDIRQPLDCKKRQKQRMAEKTVAATLVSERLGKNAPTRVEVRNDKEKALERVYSDHVAMVYSICYRMLRNRADAQDATQDVFVKVYKNLDRFAGKSKLSTWIYRIATNHCIDISRRRKLPTVELKDWLSAPKREHYTKMELEKAIVELPPSYRKVFVLHDVQGFRHAEIADILKITPGSSKSLLHRSRKLLREKLADVRRNYE